MDAFSTSLAAAALVDGQHFTIPNYGTLEGLYVSARINHVRRQVSPPRLEVRWTQPPNGGAQTLAELFVTTGATSDEAEGFQDDWVAALGSGEEIRLGDLGTLRFDSAAEAVTWVPNFTGLKSAFWAGEAVDVEPLDRRGPAPPAEGLSGELTDSEQRDDERIEESAFAKTPSDKFHLSELLRYVAMVGIVVFSLAMLRSAFTEPTLPEESPRAVSISDDRLNRSPLDVVNLGAAVVAEDFEEPSYDPAYGPTDGITVAPKPGPPPSVRSADPPAEAKTEPLERRAAAPTFRLAEPARVLDPADLADPADIADPANLADAGMPVANASVRQPAVRRSGTDQVIILGSFGNSENAGRLTERIAAKGYLPFVDQPGALTRVGVSLTVETPADLDRMLAKLRREFNPNAWVLE